jgi:hypothetical protein
MDKKETPVQLTGSEEITSTSHFFNPTTTSLITASAVELGVESIGNTSAGQGQGSEDNSSILDAVLNTIDKSGSDVNESDDELDKLMDEIDRL